MKILGLLIGLNFMLTSLAHAGTYMVKEGQSHPISVFTVQEITQDENIESALNLRVKVKKFRVTKTDKGPKIQFFDVCEKDSQINIKDLKNGGFISEEVFAVCPAKLMNNKVNVVLSGMVYDSLSKDFTDENKDIVRNFFSHLTLTGNIITGLGDFNLDATRNINFDYLTSHLSYDPIFVEGGLESNKTREGFTASVRFTQ